MCGLLRFLYLTDKEKFRISSLLPCLYLWRMSPHQTQCILFCCNLSCFVAKYSLKAHYAVLSQFVHFCAEKNCTKNCVCRAKKEQISAMCVTLDPQTRKCNLYGTLWVAGIMLVEEGAPVNWVEVEGRQLLVVGGERG